jgi:hypothetical protein
MAFRGGSVSPEGSASRLLPWLVVVVVGLEVLLVSIPPGLSILDARLYYRGAEALSFLEELGPVGRTDYVVHECIDLVFIASYTHLLRQLAAKWRLALPPLLLLAPGAADLVETAGILVLLGMDYPRSPVLAAVIGFATSAKWLATVILVVAFVIAFRRRARA